jgi:SAM-dependent methyltransferase
MEKKPNLEQVKSYFDQRIQAHGASPKGSDWNSADSQNLRFDQLLRVIESDQPFSLLDYGCGYGALGSYLESKGHQVEYHGFDILESAIQTAREVHNDKSGRTFYTDESALPVCDYVIASGIFNFRGDHSFEAWTEYVTGVLDDIDRLSRRGFSSNFLTKYSDEDKMRNDLYYADPLFLFDYCKRKFSRNVALLHDYGLYDFTILVRKA